VSVRKGLDPDVARKIQSGLLRLSTSEDGQRLLKELYNINGVAEASDREYDSVRRAARVLGLDLEEQIKPRG
jgi:ABC-type phosphate/phosphonate transport system substrate-binding protein